MLTTSRLSIRRNIRWRWRWPSGTQRYYAMDPVQIAELTSSRCRASSWSSPFLPWSLSLGLPVSQRMSISTANPQVNTSPPPTMGCEESKFKACNSTACNGSKNTAWVPYSFFEEDVDWETAGRPPFALLILNQKITNKKLFTALWKNCQCAPQSHPRHSADQSNSTFAGLRGRGCEPSLRFLERQGTRAIRMRPRHTGSLERHTDSGDLDPG
jgi:hypothetical protein